MIITDALNGRTIDDIRRVDGGVRFYTDSSSEITLCVQNGIVVLKPPKLILPGIFIPETTSTRLRLVEAFQGYKINYVAYTSDGGLLFVCDPAKHNVKQYTKSPGRREILLTHTNGVIDELPCVSAKIALEGQTIKGIFQ